MTNVRSFYHWMLTPPRVSYAHWTAIESNRMSCHLAKLMYHSGAVFHRMCIRDSLGMCTNLKSVVTMISGAGILPSGLVESKVLGSCVAIGFL